MDNESRAKSEEAVGPAPQSPPPAVSAEADESRASTEPGAKGKAPAEPSPACLTTQIQALKKMQAEMKAAKKKATMELRNLERKRSRLCNKAKLLTDDDLVMVLKLREEKVARREAEGATSGSASSSGSGASTSS